MIRVLVVMTSIASEVLLAAEVVIATAQAVGRARGNGDGVAGLDDAGLRSWW